MSPQQGALSPELEALFKGLPCAKLTIKLAANDQERAQVFRLRYQVFNKELGEGLAENEATGLDRDEFDQYCDHLMVLLQDKVIGTYRLLTGPQRPASGFYTETEFDLKGLGLDPNLCVEIGRGCILPEYRKQTTLISLFWGLHRYMMVRKARYLLGCASLATMNHDSAEATILELEKMGKIENIPGVHPLKSHTFHGDASKGSAQIPPLVGFYLQFGARIIGRAAFDPIFGCHDLLTLFDMEHLSEWGTELLSRFDRRLSQGNSPSDEE